MVHQHLDLLKNIIDTGSLNRPANYPGKLAVFGRELRFKLSDYDLPLLDIKLQHFEDMVKELLWTITGSDKITELQSMGVKTWDRYATTTFTYGKQLRNMERYSIIKSEYHKPTDLADTSMTTLPRLFYNAGYISDVNFAYIDQHYELFFKTWKEMLAKCYDVNHPEHAKYAERQIHVDEAWLDFVEFQRDAKKLQNWALKLEYPDDYGIDCFTLHASNRFSRYTTGWFTQAVRSANNLNGGYVPVRSVLSYDVVDQLLSVIATLKHQPTTHSHVISLWDAIDIQRSVFPPSHGLAIIFHPEKLFYNEIDEIAHFYEGRELPTYKLSCMMVQHNFGAMLQRASDVPVGQPLNIATYALLTYLVAQCTGMHPNEYIHVTGDTHLYTAQVETVEKYLQQPHGPFPKISINLNKTDITTFDQHDFKLIRL